jgi:hypothetical protein
MQVSAYTKDCPERCCFHGGTNQTRDYIISLCARLVRSLWCRINEILTTKSGAIFVEVYPQEDPAVQNLIRFCVQLDIWQTDTYVRLKSATVAKANQASTTGISFAKSAMLYGPIVSKKS